MSANSEEAKGDIFKSDAPIEVTADFLTFDKETETYHAKGNVIIAQDLTTLYADEALVDMGSGVATASGNVLVIDEGGNTLRGTRLQMDIKAKTLAVANARIFYKEENIHITGEVIEKTGPESYYAKDLTYTACDCEEGERPAWSFRTSSAKVTVGDFLTGWNARFYIKGAPVFYAPYLTVPVKRGRQTGLLQPSPGYSKLRGFVLENSFFWAITESTDATFYLDVESARGLGKGAEYRYIRSKKSYGEAYFYHYGEKDIERAREFRENVENLSRPEDATNDRWRLKLLHTETLSSTFNIKANINLVSDDEYFIDFGKSSADRSLESLESNISFSKSWSTYSLVGQFRYFNNLLDADDDETVQKLPEVTLTGAERKILNTPFYLSSESSLIYFTRQEGSTGQRLDIKPKISLPMNPGGWFDLTPSISPRGTFYLLKDNPEGSFLDRYLYEAKVELATTFVRVFSPGYERLQALKHTIRPKLAYTYIPEVDQSDSPGFDSVDTISKTNSIAYSLNTTLTGKLMDGGRKSHIQYLYADLSQSYDLSEATRGLTSDDDKREPFGDLAAEVIIRPSNRINITGKGSYDVYDQIFNSFSASLTATDSRGDSLGLSRRFVRDESSYLEASLRLHVTAPVDLTYFKRYSFEEYRSLETSYGMEYKHQCWSSTLTYSEKLEEKIVYLTFSLKGIGKIAGIEGKIEPL